MSERFTAKHLTIILYPTHAIPLYPPRLEVSFTTIAGLRNYKEMCAGCMVFEILEKTKMRNNEEPIIVFYDRKRYPGSKRTGKSTPFHPSSNLGRDGLASTTRSKQNLLFSTLDDLLKRLRLLLARHSAA